MHECDGADEDDCDDVDDDDRDDGDDTKVDAAGVAEPGVDAEYGKYQDCVDDGDDVSPYVDVGAESIGDANAEAAAHS